MKVEKRQRGTHVSTVTVRSSVEEPTTHTVCHTLTDIDNGTTSKIYEKTVKASKVVSALFAP